MEGKAADEEVMLLENWVEDDTVQAAAGAADYDGAEMSEVQYKYDVFISYSQCDRPWVRDVLIGILEGNGKKVCVDYRDFTPGLPIMDNIVQAIEDSKVTILVLTPSFIESEWCKYESRHALGVSLETSQARVLPLILMECEMPSILSHLTYLDNTNEDVQPFFTEILLESLEKAGKWRRVYSGYHAQGIVPVSEIQDVVTRAIDEERNEQERRKRRMVQESKIELALSRRKTCCFCPIASIFVGLFITFLLSIVSAAQYPNSLTTRPDARFFDQNQVISASNLSVNLCKALNLTSTLTDKKVMADIFLFSSEENIKQHRHQTINEKLYLTTGKFWKFLYTIRQGMHLSTKFCLFSNYSASVKLYIAKGSYDINDFESSWPDRDLLPLKFTNYQLNKNSVCSNFSLYPDNTYSRNAIIFANKDSPPVFLNASFVLHSTAFKTSQATHVCRNTSYCRIPRSSSASFVVINVNVTNPEDDGDDIELTCIVEKLYAYLLRGGVFLANIVVFVLVSLFARRKVFPLFKRCFKRQLDYLEFEAQSGAQPESETLLTQS